MPPDGFNFTEDDLIIRSTYFEDCANLQNFTAKTPGEIKVFNLTSDAGAVFVPDYQSNRVVEVVTFADTEFCVKYTYDDSKLNITKTGNTSGPAGVGDTIEYEIQVCNPTTVTVYNVTVRDSLLSGSPFSIGTLPPGQCGNVTVNLNYTVTPDDVCRGWINNTANATGDAECGYFIETDKNATWNVSTSYNSSIDITKTANTTGPVGLGEVMEYYIRVCNTGDVTVDNVTVNDSLTGGPYNIGTLTAGQCMNVTPNPKYTVTVDDVCSGWVNNTADAGGVDYCGDPVKTDANATLNLTTSYNASINITKTANSSGPGAPKDDFKYTIRVCNTGNVSVYNVTVVDNRTGTRNLGILNVSECKSLNTTYTVTQQDICNGSVVNSANASGEEICGKSVEAGPATAVVSTEYNSSINITKVANTTGPVSPGDEIEYAITVCNTGNLTVNNVQVHDNRTGTHNIGVLNVSECKSVYPIYKVTQQDICNGSVINSANATGTDYCGNNLAAGPVRSRVTAEYNSSIKITKAANTSGPVAPGDEIEYTITVCNTGNLTVTGVVVTDNRTGTHNIGVLNVSECKSLYPTYQVTQEDICNGSVINSANATGTDYCGNNLNAGPAWSSVSTEYNSSINITKVANTSGPVAPGDEIEYTITVCNTGNLTLYNVNVLDNRTGGYSVGNLEKGECDVTRRTYVVVKEDLCQPIVNIVVAEASDACGNPVNDTDSTVVDTVCYHCISGHKYWDKKGNGIRDDNDPPLEGWTIFVDLNDSGILDPGEPNDTTDASGHWQICDLIPGTYNVSEVVLEGWRPTYPPGGYHDNVDITSENVTGIDFLNAGIYCISGHKYWDKDGDGVIDAEDEPLADWVIFIDEDGDEIADPREPVTTTGGDGFWEFCNLLPGTYTVCEKTSTGWIQTRPRGPDCYTVDITNHSVTALEFLNFKSWNELWNEDSVRLGDQFALAWDMSYKDGLAKNKIEIDKSQTQRECCPGTDLFNFGNITIEDQSANSTGPGTSGNEIRIVTSQS